MTLANTINSMIERALRGTHITSASPGFTNLVQDILDFEEPDLEEEIRIINETNQKTDVSKQIKQTSNQSIDFSKEINKISKEDAGGIFKKVGINPGELTKFLSFSGGQGITGLLTRFGGLAAIGLPIAGALSIKPITEAIIKELQRPGGFLDKRVKIIAEEQLLAGLDRQTRQNTRIGQRQIIIQQFQGFKNFEGFASTNTSNMIKENSNRVLDIGLLDRAQGVPLGGK